jgi:hypothetical protein
MSADEKRLTGEVRGVSPCEECSERFQACWDHCPKDQRGEYGYKAWKADAQQVNEKRRTYAQERNAIYEEDKRRKRWATKTF